MGRRKKRKNRKVATVQYISSRKDHHLTWTVIGLLLTIITGIAMPLWFHYEDSLSQSKTMASLATIKVLQSTRSSSSSIERVYSVDEYGSITLPLSQQSSYEEGSYIRLVALSGIGTMDAFVDGNVLLTASQIGKVTAYKPVPLGKECVIAIVGKGINAAVLTQTPKLTAGMSYTFIAIITASKEISLQQFLDPE